MNLFCILIFYDLGLLGCFASVFLLPLPTLFSISVTSISPTDIPIAVSIIVIISVLSSKGILSKVEHVQISTPEIHWRLFGKTLALE